MKRLISIFLITAMIFTLGFTGVYAAETASAVSGDTIYFEEDFDGGDYADCEIGTQYTAEKFAEMQADTVLGTWGSNYTIKTTAGGKKYLSITKPAVGKGGGYRKSLTTKFTEGNLVVEMKYLVNNTGFLKRDLMVFHNTAYRAPITSNYGNALIIPDTNIFTNQNLSANPTTDKDGFWNLRMVLSRESTGDNWTLGIYDALNGTKIKANSGISPDKIGDFVDRINFVMLTGQSTDGSGATADITDLKVYSPNVTFTVAEAYNPETGTVSFEASENLDATTVAVDGAVVIKNGEDEYYATATADGKLLTVTLDEKLTNSGTYTVEFNGVKTARQAFVYNDTAFNATIVYKDKVFFEEDFDGGDYADCVAGTQYTAEAFSAMKESTVVNTWGSNYTLKTTDSGKKYLSITAPGVGLNGGYRTPQWSETERFTTGSLVAEMKYLPQTKGVQHSRNLLVLHTDKGYMQTIISNYGNALDVSSTSFLTQNLNAQPTTDDDGFWNLRLVLSRENTADAWKLIIYDALNDVVLKSNTVAIDTLGTYVDRINFVMLTGQSTDGAGATADITDLKVYSPGMPQFYASGVTFKLDGTAVTSINTTGTEISVSASVRCSSSSTENGIAILAVYDKDNNLKGFSIDNNVSAALTTPYEINLTVDKLDVTNQYKAKLILLESLDTLRPLRVAEVLSGEQF